jgi:hypothetical protein
MITRCSEKATSSAVSGLPEWNLRSGLSLKVKVLPSSLTDQLSAAFGTSVVMSPISSPISRS